jgi:hypothetical protein
MFPETWTFEFVLPLFLAMVAAIFAALAALGYLRKRKERLEAL